MKKLLYMFVFLVVGSVFGQDFSSSINTYLNLNKSELSLQSQDIEDIVIDKHSYSKSMDYSRAMMSTFDGDSFGAGFRCKVY